MDVHDAMRNAEQAMAECAGATRLLALLAERDDIPPAVLRDALARVRAMHTRSLALNDQADAHVAALLS